MKSRDLRLITIGLLFGVLFVVIAPFIFTRSLGLLSFQGKGEIGDTIGGVTAPITSLIGSLLVYYALRAQIDANRLIQKQIEQQQLDEIARKTYSHLSEELRVLRDDIINFRYSYTSTRRTNGVVTRELHKDFVGMEAFKEFFTHALEVGDPDNCGAEIAPPAKLVEVENILDAIKALAFNIQNSTEHNDRKYLMSLLAYQFNSKIVPGYSSVYEDVQMDQRPTCSSCNKRHSGMPPSLSKLCDELIEILTSPPRKSKLFGSWD